MYQTVSRNSLKIRDASSCCCFHQKARIRVYATENTIISTKTAVSVAATRIAAVYSAMNGWMYSQMRSIQL